MAAFSKIPKASFYSRNADGKGTLDSAALWSSLASRSAVIEDELQRVGGWAEGDGATITGAQTVHLGDFLVPAPARPRSGELRVWVYVSRAAGGVTYAAGAVRNRRYSDGRVAQIQPGESDDDQSASQFIDTGSGVLFGLDIDLTKWQGSISRDGSESLSVRVIAHGDASADQRVLAIAVTARPDTLIDDGTPTAWPKASIAHAGDDNTPDSGAMLRRLRDGQAMLTGRAPRVLACRTPGEGYRIAGVWFGAPGERFFIGSPRVYRYVVWRGSETGPVTLAMLATDTNADGTRYSVHVDAIADQATPQTIPSPGVDATEVIAATDTTITTDWITESLSGCWTANTWHVVQVSVWANTGVDPATGTGEVRAIVLTEDEYDDAPYLATGDTMPTGPRIPRYAPGSPIVADYGGAADDRRTLAATVAWQGWRRSQTLAIDSPYAEVSAAGVSAAGTDTSADALWYGRHRLSYGAAGLELWALVDRVGVMAGDVRPRLTVVVDGVPTASTLIVPPQRFLRLPTDRQALWLRLPVVAGVAGTTYELELWGGWYDSDGVTPASGGSESLRLLGVAIRETPDTPA